MKIPLLSIFFFLASFYLNAQNISIEPTTPWAACSGTEIVVNFTPSGGAVGPFTVELIKTIDKVGQVPRGDCNGFSRFTIATASTTNNSATLNIPNGESSSGIYGTCDFGRYQYFQATYYQIKVTGSSSINGVYSITLYGTPCPTILGVKTNTNTYTAGSKVTIDYLTNGLNSGNQISFQLSDKNGSFNNPVPLNTIRSAKVSGSNSTTELTIPSDTPVGSGYVIKVITSDPVASRNTSPFSVTAPLPVTLINFSAKLTAMGNQLYWETSNETNSQAFEIQHSTDAKAFEPIGKVLAQGNSKEKLKYQFLDTQKNVGNLSYYRLKQVDLGGKFEFSKIIAVENKVETEIKLFPNPVADILTIENHKNTILNLNLLDATGRSYIQMKNENKDQIQINLKGISKGIYFLQINDGAKLILKKIVKQ